MNMKTLVRLLLAAGIVLAIYGHVAWCASHSPTPNKLRFVHFPLIPGYALLVMGWCGWLAERVSARTAGPD